MTTLEKIRAEIEQIKPYELPCDKRTPEYIRDMALEIIDKYAEQEPCEDEYIKIPKKALKYRTAGMVFEALSHAQRDVALLPLVTPQQKTGHWIRMKAYEKWECSECSTVFRFTFKEHDYCPKCGAKMVEPQEGEKL